MGVFFRLARAAFAVCLLSFTAHVLGAEYPDTANTAAPRVGTCSELHTLTIKKLPPKGAKKFLRLKRYHFGKITTQHCNI